MWRVRYRPQAGSYNNGDGTALRVERFAQQGRGSYPACNNGKGIVLRVGARLRAMPFLRQGSPPLSSQEPANRLCRPQAGSYSDRKQVSFKD